MIRAALTGASGCVGHALLAQLVAGGHPARALFRKEDEASRYWQARGVEIVLGDLDSLEALGKLAQGTDVFFHSAATMAKNDLALSRRVNVQGTENSLVAAKREKISLFVFVSSISVLAATDPPQRIFSESTPIHGVQKLNNYSVTKWEAELRVREFCLANELAYLIFRPTNVYGPLSQPWNLKIVGMLKKFPWAIGDIPIDLVHVDDVARAMILAAENANSWNEVYHIGHEMFGLRDFVRRLAVEHKLRAHFLPKVLDGFCRTVADWAYQFWRGKVTSLSLRKPAFYSHGKATQAFGYQPQVSLGGTVEPRRLSAE